VCLDKPWQARHSALATHHQYQRASTLAFARVDNAVLFEVNRLGVKSFENLRFS